MALPSARKKKKKCDAPAVVFDGGAQDGACCDMSRDMGSRTCRLPWLLHSTCICPRHLVIRSLGTQTSARRATFPTRQSMSTLLRGRFVCVSLSRCSRHSPQEAQTQGLASICPNPHRDNRRSLEELDRLHRTPGLSPAMESLGGHCRIDRSSAPQRR